MRAKYTFAKRVERKKIVVIWLMQYEQMLFINGENGLIELLPSPFQSNAYPRITTSNVIFREKFQSPK